MSTELKYKIAKKIPLCIFVISVMAALPQFTNLINKIAQLFLVLIVIELFLIYKRKICLPFVYKAMVLMLLLVLFHVILDAPIPAQYNPYPTTYFLSHLIVGCIAFYIGMLSFELNNQLEKMALISLLFVSIFTIIYAKSDTELTYQMSSYTIMWLFPYCFLNRDNTLKVEYKKWGVLLFAIFAILVTGKRTPLLAPFIGGIFAFLAWKRFSIKSISKLILGSILLLGIAYILARDQIYYQIDRWDDDIMMAKSYDSYANGRSLIWMLLLENFNASSYAEKLLGLGFQSTKTLTGLLWGKDIGAHNDYIDSLVNYGYVGLSIHVCFSLSMLVYGAISIKKRTKESFLLLMLPIMWIITELVSSNNVRFSSALYMFLYFYLVGTQQKKLL